VYTGVYSFDRFCQPSLTEPSQKTTLFDASDRELGEMEENTHEADTGNLGP
jgi:hypothetical protein